MKTTTKKQYERIYILLQSFESELKFSIERNKIHYDFNKQFPPEKTAKDINRCNDLLEASQKLSSHFLKGLNLLAYESKAI